jgi:phosphatidylglycerophosphate synthase
VAGLTASPVRTLAAGAGGQVVLLAVLAATAGLTPAALVVGLGYAALGFAALTAAARRSGVTALGPADLVTLSRSVLVGGVTALVVDGAAPTALVVTIASVALALDAVDGRVARLTRTVSPFGARFDMEVDAFLILVLSVFVARELGPWVLAIGLMRYAFVAAGRALRWLRAELPPSLVRKTVAAEQGIVLAVASSGLLAGTVAVAVVGFALATLTWSFCHDIGWLHRNRPVVPEAEPTPARRVARRVGTGLAAVLVLAALLAPNDLGLYSTTAFVRLPVEALLVAGLVLVLPPRPRRVVAALAGTGLGLLTIIKFFDLGFNETLARPFDPVFDWSFLGPGVDFVRTSVGEVGATLAVVGVAVLALAVVVLMALSALRLSRLVVDHRRGSTRTVTVLGLVWAICAMFGVQFVPNTPVAAHTAMSNAYHDMRQIRTGLLDPQAFAKEAADDAFRHTPGEKLLTALRGKDVLITFVESYGRVAIEDPQISPEVDALLEAGTDRLRAAGFDSRSAFLESSTSGGGSWFAHATLQSGLWINNQRRYDALVAGDRLSLSNAFRRAGWRTLGIAPAITQEWPEGRHFGYDHVYDAHNVGYRGPTYSYAKMPDQYTLSHFERVERDAPNRQPLMAEIDLVSSHSPWAPLPTLVDWDDVGDGSVFDPQPAAATPAGAIWPDPVKVKAAFGDAIEYSLETLVSYVETYGDDDLVLVVLGDHQPAPIVTGKGASWDVPITIISRDRAVLDRVSPWHWQPGMNPDPNAPVWRMDDFRDRFLTAFGPQTDPSPQAAPR